MNEQALWYFEGVDLFGKLCPLKSKESEAVIMPQRFNVGETIYIPNQKAESLHIIVSGRVKIGRHLEDGRETTRAILTEGEVFGEMILAGETIRKDFAEALEKNTQICSLSLAEIQGLMRKDSDMTIKVIKWMGLRIEKLERKIELLAFRDVRTRVIEFLKDAASWKGKPVGDEIMIKTKLTHSEIAKLTATSRQTVSEVLNELREENQIYFERGKILIRNLSQLK